MAVGLWLVLALVVWQMIFDDYTKMAAYRFATTQMQAHAQGQPVTSMAGGFRPMVTAAAWRAGAWAAGVALSGMMAVWWADRADRANAG